MDPSTAMDTDDLWFTIGDSGTDGARHHSPEDDIARTVHATPEMQMALDSLFAGDLTGAGLSEHAVTSLDAHMLATSADLPAMFAAAAVGGLPADFDPAALAAAISTTSDAPGTVNTVSSTDAVDAMLGPPATVFMTSIAGMDDDYWQYIQPDLMQPAASMTSSVPASLPSTAQSQHLSDSTHMVDAIGMCAPMTSPSEAFEPESLSSLPLLANTNTATAGDSLLDSLLAHSLLPPSTFCPPSMLPILSAPPTNVSSMPTVSPARSAVESTTGTTASVEDKDELKRKTPSRRGRKKREPHALVLSASQLQPLMPMPTSPTPPVMPVVNTIGTVDNESLSPEPPVKEEQSDDTGLLEGRTAVARDTADPSPGKAHAQFMRSTPPMLPASPPALIAQSPPPTPQEPLSPDTLAMYDKRQQRLIKNRAAALLSRKRKREHLMLLEHQSEQLHSENEQLRTQIMAAEQRTRQIESERDEALQQLEALKKQLAAERATHARELAQQSMPSVTVASPASSDSDSNDGRVHAMELDDVMPRAVSCAVAATSTDARSVKPLTTSMVFMMIIFSFAIFSLPVARIALPLRTGTTDNGHPAVHTTPVLNAPPVLGTAMPTGKLEAAEMGNEDSDDDDDIEVDEVRPILSTRHARSHRRPATVETGRTVTAVRRRIADLAIRATSTSSSLPSVSVPANQRPRRIAAPVDASTAARSASDSDTEAENAKAAHELYQWLVRQGGSASRVASTDMSDMEVTEHPAANTGCRGLLRPGQAQLVYDSIKQLMPTAAPISFSAWRPMEVTGDEVVTGSLSDMARPRLSFLSPIASSGERISGGFCEPLHEPVNLASAAAAAAAASPSSPSADQQQYLRIDVEVLSSHLVEGLPRSP